jgi:hypothetical protein
MSGKLTKAQGRALSDMVQYGRIRFRSNGRWSHFPNGEYSSRTVWDLEAKGLCQVSMNRNAQATNAGRAALAALQQGAPDHG